MSKSIKVSEEVGDRVRIVSEGSPFYPDVPNDGEEGMIAEVDRNNILGLPFCVEFNLVPPEWYCEEELERIGGEHE